MCASWLCGVCVCERGRERETACVHHDCVRERESVCVRERETVHVCIMTLCVCERERVCVCERERDCM